MSDLFNTFLPLASLVAGLSGSLHCLGMCGGLVTASCDGGKDVLKYQLGRLLGYLLLGNIAWLMGYALKGFFPFEWAVLLSSLVMGGLFIFWGIQSYQGKKAELPLPTIFRRSYQFAFRKFVQNTSCFRSFVIGFISLLLPCGLIYGFIVTALALGSYKELLVSLLFFWLGTLPAMLGAPQVVKKILTPMKKKLPKVYAVIFIVIGLVTIGGRLNHFQGKFRTETSHEAQKHLCH